MPGRHGMPGDGLGDGVELLPPVVRAVTRAHATQVLESMNACLSAGLCIYTRAERIVT